MLSKRFLIQLSVVIFSVFVVPRLAGPLLPPAEPTEISNVPVSNIAPDASEPEPSHISRIELGPATAHLDADEKEVAAALPKVEILYNSNIDRISYPGQHVESKVINASGNILTETHKTVYKILRNPRRVSDYTLIINGLLFIIPCCFYLIDREIDSFRFLQISRSVSWIWLQCLCWIVSLLFLLLKCDLWENLPYTAWIAPLAIWLGGSALTWSIQKGIRGAEIAAPQIEPAKGFLSQTIEKVKKEIFHMLRA